MPRRALLITTLAAGLLLIALVLTYWIGKAVHGGDTGGHGVADIGGDFTLVDQSGQTVRDSDLHGRLRLVYFGYTYCPDICPTELQNMSGALDLLEEDSDDILPVFITVDPERDTVAVMREYSAHFHPRFLALTGTLEQVAGAAKAYRIFYAKVDDASASDYLMDHSTFVYLMDRQGRYLRHFDKGTPPETIAEGIRPYLS